MGWKTMSQNRWNDDEVEKEVRNRREGDESEMGGTCKEERC